MPAQKIPRPPERQTRSPGESARGLGTLAMLAVLGGAIGLVLGIVAGVLAGRGGPIFFLAGGVFGLTGGLIAGFLFTGGERAEPVLRPGEGLSNHILALREALASMPPKRVERLVAHRGGVRAVALSSDGKTALSGGADRAVRVWDLRSGVLLQEFPDAGQRIQAVAFSSDGRLAACVVEPGGKKETGAILIWDVESGRELRCIDVDGPLSSLAFVPRSRQLLAGGVGYLRQWDLESGELLSMIAVKTDRIEGEEVLAVAVSPDRTSVLCGCRYSQEARLYDLESGECRSRFGHRGTLRLIAAAVTSVAFSLDGDRVLTGGRDGVARVWEVENGEQLAKFDGPVAVGFAKDGKRAICGSESGTVRVWSIKKLEERARFDHGAKLTAVAATRDGGVILTGGGDGVIRVWSAETA